MWSGRRPGAESEPRINQQDFRAVDLSKMRSYIHVYIQGGGWRHPGGWMVAPPWRLELTGAHIYMHFIHVYNAGGRPDRIFDRSTPLLIDPGLPFCVWTASGPHVATIFYPPFSTTHFYLLITWLIHANIPEWLIPNLDKTQNVILE